MKTIRYVDTKSIVSLRNAAGVILRFGPLAAFLISGCASPHPVAPPTTPYDYKDRHPIVVSESPFVLDVFPKVRGGRLDHETAQRIDTFASLYKEFGHGSITVAAPVGANGATHRMETGKGAVIKALTDDSLPNVTTTDYPIADEKLAAPIRLTFTGMKAKVADRCGLWPRDLASGSSIEGWQNQTYWNFGCSTQNMIATQTLDPRDLVSPRGETPTDIELRMKRIAKFRQGSDPATSWSGKAGSISGVGGN